MKPGIELDKLVDRELLKPLGHVRHGKTPPYSTDLMKAFGAAEEFRIFEQYALSKGRRTKEWFFLDDLDCKVVTGDTPAHAICLLILSEAKLAASDNDPKTAEEAGVWK